MKKLNKMYLCYLGNGSNCLYCNPTTGRAEADEVKVVLPENVEIVTMVSGMRMVEYHNATTRTTPFTQRKTGYLPALTRVEM